MQENIPSLKQTHKTHHKTTTSHDLVSIQSIRHPSFPKEVDPDFLLWWAAALSHTLTHPPQYSQERIRLPSQTRMQFAVSPLQFLPSFPPHTFHLLHCGSSIRTQLPQCGLLMATGSRCSELLLFSCSLKGSCPSLLVLLNPH